MSSEPSPDAPLRRTAEPLGWDFEDVKFREDPIPDTWWFIPWANTECCKLDEDLPRTGQPGKLLYYDMSLIKEEYRGSGFIVDDLERKVFGCYKVRADTEAGDDARREVAKVKHAQWLEEHGQDPTELVQRKPGKKMRMSGPVPDSRGTLRSGNKTYNGQTLDLPTEIRRLNGLILDPRPAWIALHPRNPEVFRLHKDMAGAALEDYGAHYLQLEYIIRTAMKDTFDKEQELPIYRLRQIEAAKKAGRLEAEFTDELSSGMEDENRDSLDDGAEENGGRDSETQADGVVEEEDERDVGRSRSSSPLSSARSVSSVEP